MTAPRDLIVEPAGPDAAAATTGASVLAGGVWKTASTLVPQLYVLAQSIAAARFLGPRGMGLQSFIAFAEIAIVTAASSGFSIALMRYIGETLGRRQPEAVRGLVRWAWLVLGLGALAGGAILIGAGLAGADPRNAWLLAGVAGTLGILHTVPSAVLIGAQRWREASIVGLVTGTGATAAIIVVLALGGGITGMFGVEAAIAALNLVWTSAYARRALATGAAVTQLSRVLRRDVLRYALVATATSVLTFIVWRRSELFFLKRYSTDREIAFYSVAFASVTALTAVSQGLATVISPAIATLFGAGADARIRTAYARGTALVNIALDLALIPGHAAIGAAIANSSAQVLAGLPVLVYMARHVGGVDWRAGPITRGVLASGAGGLVAWGLVQAVGGPAGLVAGLSAGALTFAALVRILRVLPADDALWLDAAVGERAGGRVGRAVRLFAGLPEHGGAS